MALLSFGYYENTYLGSAITDDEVFSRYEKKAEIILKRMTFGNIIQSDETKEYGTEIRNTFIPYNKEELDALRYCLCAACDTIANINNAESLALSGNEDQRNVKSLSSGGESITYDTAKNAYSDAVGDESKKMQLIKGSIKENIDINVFRWNPFYAGVY